ncbi:DnaJ domain-containing protein [Vibrio crassostreae]|uniref:DnaJ domain-containing protein n=1 Tax=Vibrio crassostreae TaxID=246167 RepID=UPI001043EBC9|nr:DnaJ domain-containing protein [Vibrio crassostreae]TCN91229.1 DnaJ-like protein [Vibrio crassostreae]CAK2059893.1 DnaJ-like protein [Vibrio crassostreae]CAK2845089.1 DnaJ-like protein [Vibrio crassostreae]CAK2884667.1 DnaJ-like protein [Vibrio crassostreae]CAK2931382.1 DnaJ-like protein [Vibrio crassostreae]
MDTLSAQQDKYNLTREQIIALVADRDYWKRAADLALEADIKEERAKTAAQFTLARQWEDDYHLLDAQLSDWMDEHEKEKQRADAAEEKMREVIAAGNKIMDSADYWKGELEAEEAKRKDAEMRAMLLARAAEKLRSEIKEIKELKQAQPQAQVITMPKTASDALRILGLSANYNRNELKRAYREASALHHPDKGGLTDNFQAVQAAYALLKKR